MFLLYFLHKSCTISLGSDISMHIVMVEPEIPGNTGNVARLCAANHITLHLVKPWAFPLMTSI